MPVLIGSHCEKCSKGGFDPLEMTYSPDESTVLCPNCAAESVPCDDEITEAAPRIEPIFRLPRGNFRVAYNSPVRLPAPVRSKRQLVAV